MTKTRSHEFTPDLPDNRRLANLCGALDQNLRQIEEAFDVRITRRGDTFGVEGPAASARRTLAALKYFPDPNRTPDDSSGSNNFVAAGTNILDLNYYSIRVDHNISD